MERPEVKIWIGRLYRNGTCYSRFRWFPLLCRSTRQANCASRMKKEEEMRELGKAEDKRTVDDTWNMLNELPLDQADLVAEGVQLYLNGGLRLPL